MRPFLQASPHIDCDHPAIRTQAAVLAAGGNDDRAIAAACYRFVRDEIRHSWDFRSNPVTCQASDVLQHRTGYCYAKSHLLAALLRANHIPAGLCYQRLSVNDAGGAPYCLHGLNAVYLKGVGWYRCDARGNRPDIQANFCPPREQLAFALHDDPQERDLPEIWAEPLPVVIDALTRYTDVMEVSRNLPDILLWATPAAMP